MFRRLTSLLCAVSLVCPIMPTSITSVQTSRASAEPITLSIIGIAVGLAGIASDVYGMSREKDLDRQVSDKIAEVTTNQLRVGLSPLKEINPKLKALASAQSELKSGQGRILSGQSKLQAGQRRLLNGQAKLRAGQRQLLKGQAQLQRGQARIINGQAQLRAGQAALGQGQAELLEQLKALRAQFERSDADTLALMHTLHEENLSEHRRTQSLVIGLQEARYGAALKLIKLASQVAQKNQRQAEAWFNEALTALLETQSYFERQRSKGTYVSHEYLALIHLSLATCYVGLQLFDQTAQEVGRLVALPSPGESLEVLIELEGRAERPLLHQEGVIELRAWSASVQDEQRRLAEIKRRAVKLLEGEPRLRASWGKYDNAAFGRAQLAEHELALQAYATLLARVPAHASSQAQAGTARLTAQRAPKVEVAPRSSTTAVDRLDPYQAEEVKALKRVARALKDVRGLSRLIKDISRSSGAVPKDKLLSARKVFQRVTAEADAQGELSSLLTSCVARKHPSRAEDCERGQAFISDMRTVLSEIDRALDQIERSSPVVQPK